MGKFTMYVDIDACKIPELFYAWGYASAILDQNEMSDTKKGILDHVFDEMKTSYVAKIGSKYEED